MLILFTIVIFNKILYKNSANPIFLQSLIWLVYSFILQKNIDVYDVDVHDVDYFILLQAIGFSAGGFIISLFTRSKYINSKFSVEERENNIAFKNVELFFPFMFLSLLVSIFSLFYQGGNW